MRNIKFQYVWKFESSLAFGVYGLDEIENGNPVAPKTKGKHWELIDRRQFTGLLDKDGIEIYEGDIVSMPYINPMGGINLDQQDFKSEVSFDRGSFLVFCNELRPEMHTIENWVKRTEGKYVSNYGNIKDWGDCVLTVIGNIHQNPELLK